MSCYVYDINDCSIAFSEDDDSLSCLCTFPHNHEPCLSPEIVRSLAYLGAAVVLAHRDGVGQDDDGWRFLPHSLPQWIRDEIDRQTVSPGMPPSF